MNVPDRIARLPKSQGYHVPWFVTWLDGTPDFRVMDAQKFVRAVTEKLCWVCGQPTGSYVAFLIGPMCAVNQVSAEPPLHRECAEYSAKVCPFLSNPNAVRRETRIPAGSTAPAGMMIRRNPGVSLLWVTRSTSWRIFQAPAGPITNAGVLFRIGEPVETEWYFEGRRATRDEVMKSLEVGLEPLKEIATQEGPDAVEALWTGVRQALRFLPI